jgi:hypothetical protein
MIHYINALRANLHVKHVHLILTVLHVKKDFFILKSVINVNLNVQICTIKIIIEKYVKNVQIHAYNVLIVLFVFHVNKDF